MTLNAPSVAVSSPVPGSPLGSLIVVVTEVEAVFVSWVPSSVLVPSIRVLTVAGIVFGPIVSRPRL